MIKNGFIILLNLLYFSLSQIIFEFDRDLNLNTSMTMKEIFTTLAYNDLYTYIKIGTPEKEYKVSINFQEKSLVLLGSEIKRPNIFNESNSDTFKKVSEEMILIKSQIYNGYISEDVIKLNNFKEKLKIQFFLGQEIYQEDYSFSDEYEPINYCGYLGLAISQLFNPELPDSLPIYLFNNYRYNYNFNSPFSIIFDHPKNKSSYKGKLILNGYPHEYNKSYNIKFYNSSRIQKNENNLDDWCIALDNSYYGDNFVDENTKIIFRPEFGVIISTGKFFKYLIEQYFKEYLEQKICNQSDIYLISNNYNFIYCSKDINISKFENINFELKDINFNFTLNYEDLFYEYNNKYYFLIASQIYKNQFYIFGSILMKKYNLVFDKHISKIGVYNQNITNNYDDNKKNKNKKRIILIISIVILSILIIIALIYIIWNYINRPRAQRKNEIDDNYNYISEEDKIN